MSETPARRGPTAATAVELEASSQQLAAQAPEIASKDAVCDTISSAQHKQQATNSFVSEQDAANRASAPDVGHGFSRGTSTAATVPDDAGTSTQTRTQEQNHNIPAEENLAATKDSLTAKCQLPTAAVRREKHKRRHTPTHDRRSSRKAANEAVSAFSDSLPENSLATPGLLIANCQPPTAVAETPAQRGLRRLTGLYEHVSPQGARPPLEAIVTQYLPDDLNAALDWIDAHPEWSFNLRRKPTEEFVLAFQLGPARQHDTRIQHWK